MNKTKLLKLADFLESLTKKQFNFSQVVEKYDKATKGGTICCAIGWMPAVFPKEVQWNVKFTNGEHMRMASVTDPDGQENYEVIAARVLGISADTVVSLFFPHQQVLVHKDLDRCGALASPQDVGRMLRQFVELVVKKKLWADGSPKEVEDEST